MMSARSYKTKFVDPLIKRLKALVIKTLSQYFEARTDFERWRTANHSLASSNERLKNRVAALENENEYLREDLRDYKLLRKYSEVGKLTICLNKQEQTKVNGVMNAQDKITRRTTQ